MNKILMNNGKEKKEQAFLFSKNPIIIDHDQVLNIILEQDIDSEIVINKGVTCQMTLFGKALMFHTKITLLENSELTIQSFIINGNGEISIHLVGEHSKIHFCYGTLCDTSSKLKFLIDHQAAKTESTFYGNGFSVNKTPIDFQVNGIVRKEASGCRSLQDSKIIHLENSFSKIEPNLYIENYDVDASHATYIGSFKEENLFYLMSRGLSKKESYSLLTHSFLTEKMSLEEEIRKEWNQIIDSYL